MAETKQYIAKSTARMVAEISRLWGVRSVVVSPGSRCAPLTLAFARAECGFKLHTIIDERTAAFVALGIALKEQQPVVLLCTSGTAMLNYAPALAEAYYRRVPLIVLTADRPYYDIDQRDSQTIRQAHVFKEYTRFQADIRDDNSLKNLRYAERMINDAFAAASQPIAGPVHINMQFEVPLTATTEADFPFELRKIERYYADTCPQMPKIADDAKVLVVAGAMDPNAEIRELCGKLSKEKKALIFAEKQSNICGDCSALTLDELNAMPSPDYVVSMGGSLVSDAMKKWLRTRKIPHISLGFDDNINDTFGTLVAELDVKPAVFLEYLNGNIAPNPNFVDGWRVRASVPQTPLMKSLQSIVDNTHFGVLHLSNGMSVRLGQYLSLPEDTEVHSNRGCSGIEGSTSTAIGNAFASEKPVLLITGDMSAAYDLGSFAVPGVPSTFTMVILDNRGGDIFRKVATTRELPEREQYFSVEPVFPIEQLATAYGYDYCCLKPGEVYSPQLHPHKPLIIHIKCAAGDAII